MSASINKIDDGFYISSVEALHASSAGSKLRELGIRCVLNAAGLEVYRKDYYGEEANVMEMLEEFEVKILGAEDVLAYNIGDHFDGIADFIEAGRAKGGVLVHCAAGVSRSATSCIAYFMMKEHWSLEAAYLRLRGVRSCCEPNSSFWRQLRQLEESLIGQGVQLKHLPSDYEFPEQPERESTEVSKERRVAEIWAKIRLLDQKVGTVPPEALRIYLTASAVPISGFAPERLVNLLKMENPVEITWEELVPREGHVHVRVSGKAPLDGETLKARLSRNPMVQSVSLEGERANADEGA